MAVAENQNVLINFSGGLNTESSPLGMDTKYAKAMSNMKVNTDGSIETRPAIDFIGYSSENHLFVNEPVNDEAAGIVVLFEPFQYQDPTGGLQQLILAKYGSSLLVYRYDTGMSLKELPDSQPIASLDMSPFILPGTNPQTLQLKVLKDSSILFFVGRGILPFFIEMVSGAWTIRLLSLHRRKLGTGQKQNKYVIESDMTVYSPIRDTQGVSPFNNSPTPINHPQASWPVSLSDKEYIQEGESRWEVYQEAYWEGEFNHNYDEHFSLATFYKSNIVTLSDYYDGERISFRTGCVSNGRLWLGGLQQQENALYYSQTVDTGREYGRFYQFADPYRHIDNALVDTDGGNLIISGSGMIQEVIPYASGVIVFAAEGVWSITGSGLGTGFTPTSFSINKISDEGMAGERSYAAVGDSIVYLTKAGVYIISSDSVAGNITAKKLSVNVDSLFDSISDRAKKVAKMHYNSTEEKLYLLINIDDYVWLDKYTSKLAPTRYNDIIIYDFKTKSWTIYRLEPDTGDGVFITGLVNLNGNVATVKTSVMAQSDYVMAGAKQVQINTAHTVSMVDTVAPILAHQSNGVFGYAIGVMEAPVETTHDFAVWDEKKRKIDAFVECSYIYDGDLMHQKQLRYLTTVFERAERKPKENIVISQSMAYVLTESKQFIVATDGVVEFDTGGCIMRVARSFSVGEGAGVKYGKEFQAYKPWMGTTGYLQGLYPDIEFVQNKHKIRGRGHNMYIRMDKDGEKRFKLYGIQLQATMSKKAY